MAATMTAPLNAEPANPTERSKQDLPPKSFADAVEETVPTSHENGANGNWHTNDTARTSAVGSNGDGNGVHIASVLRIVDTGAGGTEDESKVEDNSVKEEYSATV